MSIVPLLYPWIDLLWLPIAFLTMERGKRILTCGFIGGCVLLLRLQIELLQQIGFPKGFFGLMESGIYPRGLVTYGGFIAFFLLIARFSPGGCKHIHVAVSITILITAFCVSTLVMVL